MMNARLLHAEALAEAVAEFGMSTQEWRAGYLGSVITQMWGQWSAVVLRSLCKKGPPRFQDRNVSIEGLLESMSGDAETLLEITRQDELRAWLRRRPSTEAIRSKLAKDKKKVLSASDRVKNYGDTIAHIQLRGRKIKGARVRACREMVRTMLDRYYRLLTSRTLPTDERGKFVDRVLEDIDRIRDAVEKAG